MVAAWIAITVILVMTAMLLLVPAEWLPKKMHERVQERARRFKVFLSLVAVVVLGTAAVQFGIPLPDLITRRSEDFYKAALWPGIILIVLLVFGRSIIWILRKANVESIDVGSSGVSMKFTTDDIRRTLDELIDELVDRDNGLTEEEKELFKKIVQSDGNKSVKGLCADFQRGNEVHDRFKNLRDLNLIRPVGGGRWEAEKYPVVTRFGRLVHPHIDRLPSVKRTEPK